MTEQAPDRESRVMLGHDRDRFGQPRVRLVWRLSDRDFESVRRAHAILAGDLAAAGIGRLQIEPALSFEDINVNGGYHHMGTTRMHADPRRGVVDANCRVHGIGNLFIASSSVFPTGGFANPTLTIGALSIRLADHLRKVVQTRPPPRVPAASSL